MFTPCDGFFFLRYPGFRFLVFWAHLWGDVGGVFCPKMPVFLAQNPTEKVHSFLAFVFLSSLSDRDFSWKVLLRELSLVAVVVSYVCVCSFEMVLHTMVWFFVLNRMSACRRVRVVLPLPPSFSSRLLFSFLGLARVLCLPPPPHCPPGFRVDRTGRSCVCCLALSVLVLSPSPGWLLSSFCLALSFVLSLSLSVLHALRTQL